VTVFEQMDFEYGLIRNQRRYELLPGSHLTRVRLMMQMELGMHAMWKRSRVSCSILLMDKDISGESGKSRCLMDCITVHK
jgi:hypothetical protein